MKKRISDLKEQLESVVRLCEVYEEEKGELIRNKVISMKLDKKLDKMKEILDRIEEKGELISNKVTSIKLDEELDKVKEILDRIEEKLKE